MNSTRILSVFWHSIENGYSSPDGANPTVDVFREHIRFLVQHYTPISIFEFLEVYGEKSALRFYKRPPILLGFDDGFKNVIRYALPILEEFKAPALFFVIGEVVQNPGFVPSYVEIKHLLRRTIKKTLVYETRSINLTSQKQIVELRRLFDASFRTCKSESDRQGLLQQLAESLDVDRPAAEDLDEDLQFVNAEDLAGLSSPLLTVGSHAMSHRDLAMLSYEEQVAELEQSDWLLRQHCPSYYPVVAYPNGSFNADTIRIAERIYKAGFAVLLGASYANLYAYPRIGLLGNSVAEVQYLISPRRRDYLLPLKRVLHATGIRPI